MADNQGKGKGKGRKGGGDGRPSSSSADLPGQGTASFDSQFPPVTGKTPPFEDTSAHPEHQEASSRGGPGVAGGPKDTGSSSTKPAKRSSGTSLGLSIGQPKTAGSLEWTSTRSDGTTIEYNIFTNIFSDGTLDNNKLEMMLNYMEASGKLDFTGFIDGIIYQGFDRLYYIRMALKKVSVSTFCRFAILGAVRGSNFSKIVEKCLDMPQDLTTLVNNSVVIKTAKKRDDLTILRFTASIPHWVAFWLFKYNIDKKIDSLSCPGWLQFPGAASLPMSKKVRLEHIEFCKAFSALLPGGDFNGNIYYTAFCNQIPLADIPTMIKEGLGIGADQNDLITPDEVRQTVNSQVARVAR
nr:MAG: nucleocapsid protein [Leptosphaeria biglobosa negative single-stranded RNA virus 9]